MILTCAAYTTKEGICDGGIDRTQALLDELGITADTWVSLQLIMRHLGLSDTLFSFCRVKKGCEEEARTVLWAFMLEVTGYANRFIMLTRPEFATMLIRANKAINKRCTGIERKMLLRDCHREFQNKHRVEADPAIKHWLNVYMCMLSDKPDHLCATHGSIALMDGAAIHNFRTEIHEQLCQTLNKLLGPET